MADTRTTGTPGTSYTITSARPTAGRMVSLSVNSATSFFWFGIDLSPELARGLAAELLAAADLAEGGAA